MPGEPTIPGSENTPSSDNTEMPNTIEKNEDISQEVPVDEDLGKEQTKKDQAGLASVREKLDLKTEEEGRSRALEIIDLQVEFLSSDRPKSGRVMRDTINQINEQYRNLDMDPEQAARFTELINELRGIVEEDAMEDAAPGRKTNYGKLKNTAQAMNSFVKGL